MLDSYFERKIEFANANISYKLVGGVSRFGPRSPLFFTLCFAFTVIHSSTSQSLLCECGGVYYCECKWNRGKGGGLENRLQDLINIR